MISSWEEEPSVHFSTFLHYSQTAIDPNCIVMRREIRKTVTIKKESWTLLTHHLLLSAIVRYRKRQISRRRKKMRNNNLVFLQRREDHRQQSIVRHISETTGGWRTKGRMSRPLVTYSRLMVYFQDGNSLPGSAIIEISVLSTNLVRTVKEKSD